MSILLSSSSIGAAETVIEYFSFSSAAFSFSSSLFLSLAIEEENVFVIGLLVLVRRGGIFLEEDNVDFEIAGCFKEDDFSEEVEVGLVYDAGLG